MCFSVFNFEICFNTSKNIIIAQNNRETQSTYCEWFAEASKLAICENKCHKSVGEWWIGNIPASELS